MHEKSKPFSCAKCQKTFALKGLLKIHMVRAHSEEKFECELCKKSFGRQTTLDRHKHSNAHQKKELSV